jgi:hypothetical protein
MDFTLEVDWSLHVLDVTMAVFDDVAGVKLQKETAWHQADKYEVPRKCFLKKWTGPRPSSTSEWTLSLRYWVPSPPCYSFPLASRFFPGGH